MNFEELGLSSWLLRAVSEQGYTTATPIQEAAIPPVLAGQDVLGCAQTGTGKTAAFALPTLDRLSAAGGGPRGRRKIRALVLSPTRELALQISQSFQTYGKHTSQRATVVFGGVGQNPQVRALKNGVDILIATPGRLLDLMNQGYIDLSAVEVLILDEADRMLDMGFLPDLKRIVSKVPNQRQTLLFSATMPANLQEVVDQWLKNPVEIRVTPVATTAEKVQQSVMYVDQQYKLEVLTRWLTDTPWTRALIFTKTKHGADKVVKHLMKSGIEADAFHSNKSQSARQRTLTRFKAPKPVVLVATDIAARGLDIDNISHVVNFDLPIDAESYVHRIGRTGRAGAEGIAMSFCSHLERKLLHTIQRLTKQTLPVEKHPAGLEHAGTTPTSAPAREEGRRSFGKPFGTRASSGEATHGGGARTGQRPFGKRPFGAKPAFGKSGFNKRRKPAAS